MAKLPKIARDRLRQRNNRSPVDLRSAGGLDATPAASLGAGQHPDANLLAAFAERRLAGSERTLLLGHLADCAQCRELVALAFPSPEVQAAMADATRPASGSSAWLRWPVAANGAEVWAGGSGGALYHSTDGGGEHWVHVLVGSDHG